MDEQNELLKQRRPCSILNSEMNQIEPAWFHMWFIPPADGWPKGLVELSDGRMICLDYRKIIFDRGEEVSLFDESRYQSGTNT